MKRAHPNVAHRAVSLLTSASLVFCAGTSGHVLAASQDPATAPATTAPPATTEPTPGQPSAKDLSDQAIERFKAKDYDAAARLFEQAYGIDKNPNYLFNIGRVYEEKGDIRLAVDFYQRFVKEPGVDIGSRELAVQRLSVLRAILRETEPAATGPTEPAAGDGGAPPPTTAKPIADDPDPKKSMRLGGYAMLGVGGIALIVGGIFGGLTLAKKSELDDSHVVEDRKSLAHQGKGFAVVSDVTLFTGAAFAITGLVLVLVARKPRAQARTALAPSLGRDHAGLTWSLRF